MPSNALLPCRAPTELVTAQDVASSLTRLFRQAEAGSIAGAIVPWMCDALPSPKSRREYLNDLKAFSAHMRRHGVGMMDVTGDHVRLYKEAMREAGLKPGTIARRLSCLRGTYEQFGKKHLVSWDAVADIQAVESPRVDKNTTPCLDEITAKKLLHAPDQTTLGGIRDHALLFTFFITACRSRALALAHVGDVELVGQDYELLVVEKGDRRARKALLEAAAPLRRYIAAAGIADDLEGPLFRPLAKTRDGFERRHLSGRTILKIVKKYARLAGLSNVDVAGLGRRGVCTHSLRKTALNNALEHGAPIHEVQALAGHADIRTTQGYINYQESDSRSAARHIQIR